jgi:hypothetical protein
MSDVYHDIKTCRVCESSKMDKVLELSPQYIATTFVKSNENNPMSKIKVPLTLLLCTNCGLVQLRETTKKDLLYKNYFYRTAINDTMKKDLLEVVEHALSQTNTNPGDIVVDIGANDCTMVSMFPDNLTRIGVEPATNINWKGVDTTIQIVNDYFSKEVVLEKTQGKKAKIITSTAMFYDFDNPNIATNDIKSILDTDGVCIIQVSNLLDTIKDMNFYDIVHEHLEYYSLESLDYLMEKNGLSIIDAVTNAVNGGSIRIVVTHKERNIPKSKHYQEILDEERKWALRDPNTYEKYGKKIDELIDISKNFILNEIKSGGLVIALGASTKGNVLLQLLDIGKELLPYISERNQEKVGLKTLGTDIEIISEEEARNLKPSAMLVIPWNFKNEIISRENEYLENGGKLLFLMPYPYYVTKNGETKLKN